MYLSYFEKFNDTLYSLAFGYVFVHKASKGRGC